MLLETVAVSTGVVFLGEMGDKTQLLALLLAARFRRPAPIVLGILVATLANHAGAAALGGWLQQLMSGEWLRWVLGGSFVAVAVWMLIPDAAEEPAAAPATSAWGVFGVTTVAFFLAEMGDKTQVATVMLGAHYPSVLWVTAGTTLGMMAANVPVVWLGDALIERVPMAWVHRAAALVFLVLGAMVLLAPRG
jgi:Ca2+/H+ antiporter, TMEM165/GDT1 family